MDMRLLHHFAGILLVTALTAAGQAAFAAEDAATPSLEQRLGRYLPDDCCNCLAIGQRKCQRDSKIAHEIKNFFCAGQLWYLLNILPVLK